MNLSFRIRVVEGVEATGWQLMCGEAGCLVGLDCQTEYLPPLMRCIQVTIATTDIPGTEWNMTFNN